MKRGVGYWIALLLSLWFFPGLLLGAVLWLQSHWERMEAPRPALHEVCRHIAFEWWPSDLCGLYQQSRIDVAVLITVAATAWLALAFIALAGRLARRDRRYLVLFFTPGLRLVGIGASALLLLQGLSLAWTIFAFAFPDPSAFGPTMAAIAFVAGGAAISSVALLRNVFAAIEPEPLHLRAVELLRAEQPRIWHFVDDVAAALDTVPPGRIFAGLDTGFFVTAGLVKTPQTGLISGEMLYMSLPFMRVCDTNELRGIVAHELAHFKGDDTGWRQRLVPAFAAIRETLERSREQDAKRPSFSATNLILMIFAAEFGLAQRDWSRRREAEADEVAASVAGKHARASSLTRLTALGPVTRWLKQALSDHTLDPEAETNLSAYFAFWAADHFARTDHAKIAADIAKKTLPHPVDTHPPLTARLAALDVDPQHISDLIYIPAETAIGIIDGVEDIERRLSREEVEYYASRLTRPFR